MRANNKIITLFAALSLYVGIAQADQFVVCNLFYLDTNKPDKKGELATKIGWVFMDKQEQQGVKVFAAPSMKKGSLNYQSAKLYDSMAEDNVNVVSLIGLESNNSDATLDVYVFLKPKFKTDGSRGKDGGSYKIRNGKYNGLDLAEDTACTIREFSKTDGAHVLGVFQEQIDIIRSRYGFKE